jgi:uncharacterized membrane protein
MVSERATDTPRHTNESGPGRLASIDALRGLIMIVMAIDHASFLVGRFHSGEMWAGLWTRYQSPISFLTRFVTHFCAPGFFFLMGVGISLLADARIKQGWSAGRISRFLLTRGLLLVPVSFFLEIPAWLIGLLSSRLESPMGPDAIIPGEGPPMMVFTVLVGLGLSMVLASAFIRARTSVWAGLAAASLLASMLLTPGPEHLSTPRSFLSGLFLIPGITHHIWIQYPVIPWFGIAALGVLFGRWIAQDRRAAFGSLPWLGLGAIVVAIGLRAYGGLGNIRAPRDGSWIEFLNFIKYPPALVFTLFTLGGNLLVLAWLERMPARLTAPGNVLRVFGQAPLAFYLAHLWLFALVGAAGFRDGTGYLAVYIVWLAGLWPLYFVTRRYRDFKCTKPIDSYWRMF